MARSYQTWRALFTFEAAGTTVHRLLLSVMYCSGQPDEQSTDSSPDVNFDSQSTKAKAVALSPAKAAYFRSSTSQTSAPYIFEFIEYRGVTAGAHGLVESLIFRVDYGPKHGKAQMRMRVTNFPENCIPSEERASVQEHLNKAVSLIPQRERDYLRRKYRLDVTELFLVVDARDCCCDNALL